MGGSAGSIIASNPYPTFENLPDEWADWPMKWSAAKKKPLVLEEIALPFIHNYANWRNDKTGQYNGWNAHRQLFYEQAARYFGDSVYGLELRQSGHDPRKRRHPQPHGSRNGTNGGIMAYTLSQGMESL